MIGLSFIIKKSKNVLRMNDENWVKYRVKCMEIVAKVIKRNMED